jgi:hypothetical protein
MIIDGTVSEGPHCKFSDSVMFSARTEDVRLCVMK